MEKLFDSHVHYDDEKFNKDINQLLQDLQTSVEYCVSAGYNIESSKKAINLSEEYNFIYATCGISPNDVPQNLDILEEDYSKIKMLAKHKKVVAIGEIGLDYYWNKENKQIQLEYFKKQIELANEIDLPIVIHTREAIVDTIAVLRQKKVNRRGIFHCCPFNVELVKEGLKLGFMISFAGSTTFKNAKNADNIIKMVPLEYMLIETDSPYLAPEPKRGTRNDSRNLIYIAQKIAQIKKVSVEEIIFKTKQNAKEIFKIK